MLRPATNADMDQILNVYALARKYMRDNGNASQWGNGYPSAALLETDIANNRLYVCEADKAIHGAFVFFLGEEPDYAYIEDGAWVNDEPYGVIHRVASDGTLRGFFSRCADFCKTHAAVLRIDTHKDNAAMRRVLEKNGFVRCGTIFLQDGSARIAYQFVAGK